MLHGCRQRAGNLVGRGVAERRREGRRRLADQIGLGDTREEALERCDAALLGQSAGDPVDALETRKRRRRGIGVRRLGIVDEQHVAAPADLLHAVGEAGEAPEPRLDLVQRQAAALRRPDERDPPQRGLLVAPLVAGRAHRGDQPLRLVEPDRRGGDAGALREVPDGQLGHAHQPSRTSTIVQLE